MKKHFAKVLLFVAMCVAGFGFVGCNDMEKELADLSNKLENLESSTAANLQAAIDALNAKLASDYALKTDVSALEAALNGTIAEKVAAVEAKLNKTIEDAIAAAKAENADAIAKVSADLAAVSEELAAVADEIKDATAKIDENTAAIAGVDAKALELKMTIDSLAEYLDVLEAQVKENNSTLVSLSDYLAVLEAQVKENNSTLVSLSEYMEAIEAMIKENNSTLVSLSEFLEIFEGEVDMKFMEIHGSLAALSTYLEELEASIDARFAEHQNTFASLSIFLEEHEIAVDAKFAEILNTLESLAQHLDAEEAEVEAKLNELRNTLESLSPVIAQMQAQINENNSTLVSLSAFLEEVDYQGQIDSVKAEIAATFAMVKELEASTVSMVKELEASTAARFEEHQNTFASLSIFLEEQLAALAQKDVDVQAVLDAYKAEIEAAKVALGVIGEQVAIIANQVQSVVYVPEYVEGMAFGKYAVPTSADENSEFVLVQGTFEVSPKHLASKIEDCVMFSAVWTKTLTKAASEAEYFEAKVIDADDATGRIVAYAYVPATDDKKDDVYNHLVGGKNVQFSLVVADEAMVQQIGTENIIDLGSYVASSYVSVAEYDNVPSYGVKDYVRFFDGEKAIEDITIDDNTHDVQFGTAIAKSSRNLFDGYSYCVVLGEEVYTLAEAADLFNVNALNVTYGKDVKPDYEGEDAEDYITVTGKNLNATAKLAKAASAEEVGYYVDVTVAPILVNGAETALNAAARYEIVNETYTAIVIDPVSKVWAYDVVDDSDNTKHATFTAVELGVKGISDVNELFYQMEDPDDNTIGNSFEMTVKVGDITYTATIMKYESSDEVSTASKIVKASLPALPFGKTYVFETTLTKNKVDYPVSFEVSIGSAPKDIEIQLPTLNATVSANNETVINSNFVGEALAKHASFYNGVKFGQVYSSFNDGEITITGENGNEVGSVDFEAAPEANNEGQFVDASGKVTTDVKKYVEASTITISDFAKGTYNVKYVVNAYGVKYTYLTKLNVVEPNYSLATVSQFVKNGVVSVSGVTTMPSISVDKTGGITEKVDASFESHKINLKDYFQVEGVAKEYASDVKVVYTVKKYTEDHVVAPLWLPEYNEFNLKGIDLATLSSTESAVSADNGKVLSDVYVKWVYLYPSLPWPDMQMAVQSTGTVDSIEVSAYLVKESETASTDKDLAKVAYDKETITIVQKDRISSFAQIAGTGEVAYKNGENKVNIMSFIETKDFNGNVISNPYATSVSDYWFTPTGYKKNVVNAGVALLYNQNIVFGQPECDLLTAGVSVDYDGTLTFTNNSADLLSDVEVTIPVYLTYDYDNFGSTAKKVEVKVTFKPTVADDTTTEDDDTTTEGGDASEDLNGAENVGDDDMFVVG